MFGRFELLDRIGTGGMAEVWRARVGGVGGFEKILVVKKILPAFAQNKTFIDMLLAEARLCAMLTHANIVQTYENGEIDGVYYIAMEYVQGPDLFRVLSRATKLGQRIPEEICLYVAAEVAKGLHYAHNARDHYGRSLHIIHRDVSPSNVILSDGGEVKVMDFGVARATPGDESAQETRSGVLKGKLGYMSPEQVTGQPFDHRSDIFSLGILLYETLTLKRLFLAKTDLETLVNIRDARIDHKLKKHDYISAGVADILRKALARDVGERYATAMSMHDDILRFLYEHKRHVSSAAVASYLPGLFDGDESSTVMPPPPRDQTKPERPLPVLPGSTPPEEATWAATSEHGKASADLASLRQSEPQPSIRSTAPPPPEAPRQTDAGLRTTGPQPRVELAADAVAGAPTRAYRLRTGDGQEIGPIDQANLEAMLRARTARPDDAVSIDGGPFQAIRQVSALKSLADILGLSGQAPSLQGPLSQFVFVRLIYRTFANRSTGCLELRRGDVVKSIYFRRGRVQYIASNQHNELLGPFMVAQGFLSQSDLDAALTRAKTTGGRLGDLLIGLNLIKPFQLFQVLERQLRAKFIDAFGWETGQFAFYAEVNPPADIVPLDIDPLTVLTDGVRERVALSVLEPWFQDKLDRRFYRVRAPVISLTSLRFQARESKAQGALLAHDTLRPSYEECYHNRPARLALLHVMFLLLQTDLITFDAARA
jgi:serine/threonine protein kinase